MGVSDNMSQPNKTNNPSNNNPSENNPSEMQCGIHCNECDFEGQAHTNSSTIFIIFFVLLCSSVLFLPLIVVALVYMAVAISRPAKKSCPQCKSTDIIDFESKFDHGQQESVVNTNKSQVN